MTTGIELLGVSRGARNIRLGDVGSLGAAREGAKPLTEWSNFWQGARSIRLDGVGGGELTE
jgi:hypothetical protein